MGRKIPAKKHRGVKDPLVQQARRLASVKDKINAPPRDPDEQPVPKSLVELFSGTTRGLRAERPPRRRAPAPAPPREGVAGLRRLPGEGARSFARRITGAVRALHQEPHMQHYPQEAEEEEPFRERRRRRAAGGGGGGTRALRRKLKRQEKIKHAAEEVAADARAAPRYERLSFGDTAHAPPALARPRGARGAGARRGLLLARALHAGGGEGARLAAVAAYRALKAQRGRRAQ